MNSTETSKTALGINAEQHRIRIHASTLKALGNPSHVQLLVNPESRIIAIRAVDKIQKGDQTYRLPKTDRDTVITSKAFMLRLQDAFPDLIKGRSCRLSGIAVSSEQIALFSVDTMTVLNTWDET